MSKNDSSPTIGDFFGSVCGSENGLGFVVTVTLAVGGIAEVCQSLLIQLRSQPCEL